MVLSFVFAASRGVEAKDEWLRVRSKNFNLVGNASEKDIRKVATRMEQFRETFRLLFRGINVSSPIPTNVVVFKNESAFKFFLPRRGDGKADTGIAGYFQSGQDANFIAVSTEREDADTFGTIYHEYVHFMIDTTFGKWDVPPWFNEGFAEYYQTYQIEEDQKVKLGLPQSEHLYLLQHAQLIPLEQLFAVDNRQLHANGGITRSIIYAESWALIHYLMASQKGAALDAFLNAVLKGTPQDKAFRDAFGTDYASMEKELRKYVEKNTYQYSLITLKNKLTFDADMQVSPLSDADMNAYLGDLLYHTDRAADAEPYLQTAIKLDPASSRAAMALAMVKMKQRKFDEARGLFEKVTAGDPKNHIAYYNYAYLLSREGMDEFGYVRSFPQELADRMRALLLKAIEIEPTYVPSYELSAFISLVNNDKLEESLILLRGALKHQPGNEKLLIRAAELFFRLDKLDEATTLARKLAERSDDDEIKSRAQSIVAQVDQKRDFDKRIAEARKAGANVLVGPPPALGRRSAGEPPMSEAEINKRRVAAENRSVNESLREPKADEKRVVGTVEKIGCKGQAITYTVKTAAGPLTLTSKDFQGIEIISFVPDAERVSVGCNSTDLAGLNAVVTFKEAGGQLTALEFVPAAFRMMTRDEIDAERSAPSSFTSNGGPPPDMERGGGDVDAARTAAMMEGLRAALRQPAAGERREMGYLESIECKGKVPVFVFKTAAGQALRLSNSNPQAMQIKLFVRDLAGMQFGCGVGVPDFPVLVVYKDAPDAKLKTAGEVVSLDFVPKSFTLQ